MRLNTPGMLRLAGTCLALLAAFVPVGPVRAQTPSTLEVMDWNIHHGIDTGGANNLERVATWIVRIDPEIVSLNEVEKQNGYNGNADEPAVLQSLLETKTGATWYSCFAQRNGASTGQGNLLLSRIRIESCGRYVLTASRSVARATVTVNGIAVNVFSTHLDDGSASIRTTQVGQLTTWAAQAAEQRIIMGDFNAQAGSNELQVLRTAYDDTWAVALSAGTAIAYPANPGGNTRNSRIDYIWRSKGATRLALQSVQVYDTGTVSDHRPLSATFTVTSPPTTSAPDPPRNVRVTR